MPLYDLECRKCRTQFEGFGSMTQRAFTCPHCGGRAKKIFKPSGAFLGNSEPAWLRSTAEVFRESKSPEAQKFVSNPTRENYRKALKAEGVRPVDYTVHGAPPVYQRRGDAPMEPIVRHLLERQRERHRIEVRG